MKLYSSPAHFRIAITTPQMASTTAAMALRDPKRTQIASIDRQRATSVTYEPSPSPTPTHDMPTPTLFAAACAIGVCVAFARGRRYRALLHSEADADVAHGPSAEEARALIMADVAKRIAEAERVAEQESSISSVQLPG